MKNDIQLQKANYQIRSLIFSPNGRFLATIGENADKNQTVVLCETASGESPRSTIRLFSLSGEELGQLEGNEHYVYDLQISPDGQYLSAVDHPYNEESTTLRLWNISSF